MPGDTQWWWLQRELLGGTLSPADARALPFCLLGRGLWLVLAASAEGWPRLCGWGPGLCGPDPFHAPISSVFCLRSSRPAVCLLISTLTALSASWKDCPLLVSSSFKNKFSQSRNSPSGNSFCPFFVPTAACIICQYDDFFLSLNHKINHSSTESDRQFTMGDSSPKAALVPSCYLSSLPSTLTVPLTLRCLSTGITPLDGTHTLN